MTVNNFLNELVTETPAYVISGEDKKTIRFEGVEKFIFNKLSSSKYKASSMPQDLKDKVREKIKKSVDRGLPIHVTVPFGGYKKWQLPTYPYPDFAEVFNIVELREYLTPIAKVYKPGVILHYFSDEVFVARMNNYPQKDLDEYNREFEKLLSEFQKFVPSNFELRFSKIRDEINQEELMKRFEKTIRELRAKWKELPKEERVARLKKSERNYREDLSGLSEEEKENVLLKSTLIHDAFIFGDWDTDVPWAFGELMIALGFCYTKSWGIHVKSSRSSTVQFWIGLGAVREIESGFVPTILTYQQYLGLKDSLKEEKVGIFKGFQNLGSIPVVS